MTYFANKYAISEIHRQMVHLECFYLHIIDIYYADDSKHDPNRDHYSVTKIFACITHLLSKVSSTYLMKTSNDNNCLKFLNKTCILPNKIASILISYRKFYPVRLNDKIQPAVNELKELMSLFRSSCIFIEKNLVSRSFFNELKFLETDSDLIQINGYCEKKQLEIVTQCIEISLCTEINNLLIQNLKLLSNSKEIDELNDNSADSDYLMLSNNFDITNVNLALKYVRKKMSTLTYAFTTKQLTTEIDINDKYYYDAFNDYFFNRKQFKSICVRLILKEFVSQLLELISVSKEIISHLHSSDVKKILNLYLFVHHFIVDNNLKKFSLNDLLSYSFMPPNQSQNSLNNSNSCSLNELFQPFLLLYIDEQETKFTRYIDKLYDMNKINSLAEEIEKSLAVNKNSYYSISDGELNVDPGNVKHFSTSVTDLFTILHGIFLILPIQSKLTKYR